MATVIKRGSETLEIPEGVDVRHLESLGWEVVASGESSNVENSSSDEKAGDDSADVSGADDLEAPSIEERQENLESLTNKQLRAELKRLSLPTTGDKDALVARLRDSGNQFGTEDYEPPADEDETDDTE